MKFITFDQVWQIVLLIVGLLVTRHFIRMYLVVLIKRAVNTGKSETVDEKQKRVDTLVNTVGTILTLGLIVAGVFVTLAILKVNIVGLLTAFSALGVVFGIITQSLIKDILAGMYILIENQYRVGDVVTLGTVTGTVQSISLRMTRLRDFNGDLHFVANSVSTITTNKTFGWSNVNLNISVSYDSDMNEIEKLINDIGQELAEDEEWSMHIIEPIQYLRVDSFEESSVTVKALGKVEAGQQWAVAGAFRAMLKEAFEEEGIVAPFPQRVVHTEKSIKPAKKKAT